MSATTPLRELSLEDRYTAVSGPVLLDGMQALVRMMLDLRWLDARRGHDTGVFVSGYPGSPLGGLDLELQRAARHLEAAGIVFRPGLNEELAATAVGRHAAARRGARRDQAGRDRLLVRQGPRSRSRVGRDSPRQPLRHRPAGRCRRADRGRPDGEVLDRARQHASRPAARCGCRCSPPATIDGGHRARPARRGALASRRSVDRAEDRHRPCRLLGRRRSRRRARSDSRAHRLREPHAPRCCSLRRTWKPSTTCSPRGSSACGNTRSRWA